MIFFSLCDDRNILGQTFIFKCILTANQIVRLTHFVRERVKTYGSSLFRTIGICGKAPVVPRTSHSVQTLVLRGLQSIEAALVVETFDVHGAVRVEV